MTAKDAEELNNTNEGRTKKKGETYNIQM